MNDKDAKAIKTAEDNRGRAKAQSKAYARLAKAHREEYENYYRDECAKMGLNTRIPAAERLAAIRAELKRLEEKYGGAGA